jgi:hypothetical protein
VEIKFPCTIKGTKGENYSLQGCDDMVSSRCMGTSVSEELAAFIVISEDGGNKFL